MDHSDSNSHSFIVIDQGNTLTKLALYADDKLVWVRNYDVFSKIDFKALNLDPGMIRGGIISSVASDPHEIAALNSEISWIVLDHQTPIPVTNCYSTPESLGKDRLAGVVAAANRFPHNDILVIDAGTAITYDFINDKGEYIGGSISPGLKTRFKALHTFTGRLPLYEPGDFAKHIGNDTYGSIMSGVMQGTLFEIEGFISKYSENSPRLVVILTGGDYKYFDKKLKSDIFVSENLILDGLKLILQYNLEK